MRYVDFERKAVSAVKYGIYAIALTPFFVYSGFYFPNIFTKVLYSRTIIELLFLLYIPVFLSSKEYRPKKSTLLFCLAFFVLAVFISMLFGENIKFSFWGNYERMDGVFYWIHYWVLAVIAYCVLKTKKEWNTLFLISVGSSVFLSFYGFLQKFGSEAVLDSGVQRITGIIGNPGFFATYLLFNIALSAKLFFDPVFSKKAKLILGLSFAVQSIALVFTGVRGAFLGYLFGMLVFLILYVFWILKNKKFKIAGLVFFILIFFSVVLGFIFRNSEFILGNKTVSRLFSISLEDTTAKTRLMSWRIGLNGFPDNPLLGVGPQNFNVVYNKYFDPAFYSVLERETWWDKAHNIVVELVVTLGILGFLSYFFVGFLILRVLLKHSHLGRDEKIESSVFVAFLGSYFVQNLFIFDTVTGYLMMALFFGYFVFLEKINKQEVVFKNEDIDSLEKFGRKNYKFILLVCFLIFIPISYKYNFELAKYNKKYLHVLRPTEKDFKKRTEMFEDILLNSDFDKRDVVTMFGEYLAGYSKNQGVSSAEMTSAFELLFRETEDVLKDNPKDVYTLINYANNRISYAQLLYAEKKESEAKSVLSRAEECLALAIKLSPKRQQAYFSLATSYLVLDEHDEAISILDQAIKLNPNTPSLYWLKSNIYSKKKDDEKTIEYAMIAIDKGYRLYNEQMFSFVGEVMIKNKKYENLLILYKRLLESVQSKTQDDLNTRMKIAVILAEMGDKEEATKEALGISELYPDTSQEIDRFIEILNSGKDYSFIDN